MVQFYRPTPEQLESARRFKERMRQAGYKLMSHQEIAEWRAEKRKLSQDEKPPDKDPKNS